MNHVSRMRGLVRAAASGSELSVVPVLAELQGAFGDFRARNQAQIDRLNNSMNEVIGQVAALTVGGAGGVNHDPDTPNAAHAAERKVMSSFVRNGRTLSTDSDPDGGFLTGSETSKTIAKRIYDRSPMGRLARVISLNTGNAFVEPIDVGDPNAEWVGEHDDRDETDPTKLRELTFDLHEIYANQPVTQRLLDDATFDIAGWVEGGIIDKFARKEGAAYISGNGKNKPRGLLQYDTSTDKDGVRPWTTLQYIPSGDAVGFPAAGATFNPTDVLIDMVYTLRAPYRTKATWLMSAKTASTVRKWKDTDGRYIWSDPITQGQPAFLLGYPVETDEEMPDIAANSFPIAFGDFQQAYTIVHRPGVRMLRDPFTAKPKVLFYCTRRVGGGVHNGEAVKLLKIAAS